MRIPQARITAPAVHACLFALAYTLWLLFEKGAHSPARLDLFAVLWIADVPISVLVRNGIPGNGCGGRHSGIAGLFPTPQRNPPTATTAYSAPGAAVHGLTTVMPAARKGASSRVATLKRRDAAMAAIWASATAIE
jgi:hypothetical protein